MSRWYIVAPGGIVREACDLIEGARWFDESRLIPFEDGGRVVARDELPGGIRVSTVFLGLDHGWGGGPPVLFETMIFGGPHDDFQERYCTVEEAREGHKRALELATKPKDTD